MKTSDIVIDETARAVGYISLYTDFPTTTCSSTVALAVASTYVYVVCSVFYPMLSHSFFYRSVLQGNFQVWSTIYRRAARGELADLSLLPHIVFKAPILHFITKVPLVCCPSNSSYAESELPVRSARKAHVSKQAGKQINK